MTKTPPSPLQVKGGSLPLSSSSRERDDNYSEIIANISPRWRVIICKDNIQMIVQRRSVLFPNTGTWSGKSYCATLKGLTIACSRFKLISQDDVETIFTKFHQHQLYLSTRDR